MPSTFSCWCSCSRTSRRNSTPHITDVTFAILLTLAMRPIGAYLFGRAADRWGRRPTLMIDVLLYSAIEFASGFAPSLTVLLVLRAIFGIAMGGEWGVGASLTMEIDTAAGARLRVGPAAVGLSGRIFPRLDRLWPAVSVYRMARYVHDRRPTGAAGVLHPPHRPGIAELEADDGAQQHVGDRAIALAAGHLCHLADDGLQFLQPWHAGPLSDLPAGPARLSPHEVGLIAVIYNIGAIIGGISFGALSERFGRRRIIIIAALLSLVVLPLWAFSTSAVWLAAGAFLMQVMVQGAWGVVPAHLNELSPDEARGTFPGFVYQLGNLIASVNATLQATIATHYGGNYALALAAVAGTVAVAIVILTALGTEAKGIKFGAGSSSPDPALVPRRDGAKALFVGPFACIVWPRWNVGTNGR